MQVRRAVRSPDRSAGKRMKIESVSQICCKTTACFRFMQPIKNWLVPSMVGSNSQLKNSSRLNFFIKIVCATPAVFFL